MDLLCILGFAFDPQVTGVTEQDDDGHVVVHLNGVDVYDPTTGEVRSNDTGWIARWMAGGRLLRHVAWHPGGDNPWV